MKAGSNANVRTPWANEHKGAANVPVQETKKKASKKKASSKKEAKEEVLGDGYGTKGHDAETGNV